MMLEITDVLLIWPMDTALDNSFVFLIPERCFMASLIYTKGIFFAAVLRI